MGEENTQVTPTPEAAPASPTVSEPAPVKESTDSTQTPSQVATPENLEEIRQIAKRFKENESVYGSYEQFEEVLNSNPELAKTLEQSIRDFVLKSNNQQTQQHQTAQQQVQQGPSPGQVIDPITRQYVEPVTALRNELRYKDYVSEFTRVIQSVNLPQNEEVLNEAFRGTVNELLARNNDPFGNFTPNLVKDSFQAWYDRTDKLNRHLNSAYAAAKAKDKVPPSGSGGVPIKTPPEIMTTEQSKSFMVETLKAARKM